MLCVRESGIERERLHCIDDCILERLHRQIDVIGRDDMFCANDGVCDLLGGKDNCKVLANTSV